MRQPLQRATRGLATAGLGTWPRAVPWLGLGLLALAFIASVGVRTDHYTLSVPYSAGQLLTGVVFAGFVAFQVAGSLWSLFAGCRRC